MAVAAMTLASVFGLAPAAPAEAQVDPPILVIGGNGMQESNPGMQAWLSQLNAAGYDAHVMQLESLFGGTSTPGWARMQRQGWAVEDKVDEILGNTSATTIQLVGISQGALAAREYINKLGGTNTVSSLISFAGVNGGISYDNDEYPGASALLQWCFEEEFLDICTEIVHGNTNATLGQTNYLKILNGDTQPPGNPTPGNIDYYHICSTTVDDGAECWLPAGHAFTEWSPQDLCNNQEPVGHADGLHPVMQELIWAAIEGRQPSSSVCPS